VNMNSQKQTKERKHGIKACLPLILPGIPFIILCKMPINNEL